MSEKTCTVCKATLPLAEFRKRRKDSSTVASECRKCHNTNSLKWKHSFKGVMSKAKYLNSEAYEAQRNRFKATESYRLGNARGMRNRWADPVGRIKHAARVAVRSAVRRGKIVKAAACECCGDITSKLQGHHYAGYEQENRLSVRWLCFHCHPEVHRLESLCG